MRDMSNIVKSLDNALKRKDQLGWEKIYILVDIHDTIFKSCYDNEETYQMYPWAKAALQMLSFREDICLILWTSTYQDKIDDYLKKLASMRIKFDMVNCNTEVSNTKLSCFDSKLYFNVGIDDKFGFDPNTDWKSIWNYLIGVVD